MKRWLILLIPLFLIGVAKADYLMKTMQVLVINSVKIWDGEYSWKIDSIDGSGITMDIEHHKLHNGEHWFATDYDEDMDITPATYWLFITPDDKKIHIIFESSLSASGTLEFFENTTTTNNGTVVPVFNNYRGMGSTEFKLFNTSTVSTDGDRMGITFVGSGVGKKSIGGGDSRNTEVILKNATYYSFKFSPTTDDTKGAFIIDFYEVDV